MTEAVRSAWVQFLTRAKWDYFITLTFDPRRHPRSGHGSWCKAWNWFQYAWLRGCAIKQGTAWEDTKTVGERERVRDGEFRWSLANKRVRLRGPWANAWKNGRGRPMWVLGIEPHRDNRLHAHALWRCPTNMPRMDYGIGQRIWWDARGRPQFDRPRSQKDVTSYVTEYIIKEEGAQDCGVYLSENLSIPRMDRCERIVKKMVPEAKQSEGFQLVVDGIIQQRKPLNGC